ncbi:MAG: aconitate hydratase AcnA [Candidatus Omnitrophica bacterium]|nr:aconitate hydratase AcnA [Candidatus Omnitrophota bacterium]
MSTFKSIDSFNLKATFRIGKQEYAIFKLDALKKAGFPDPARLPVSLRILLENLLRCEDDRQVRRADIEALAHWNPKAKSDKEIAFTPARVLLQDFTGVPAITDLAAMRDAIKELGGDPALINPLQSADLVIDHSIQVDFFGTSNAFQENAKLEFERNRERYQFLRWGQHAFHNFRVVPPNTGIVHQVNLEYLAQVVFVKTEGAVAFAYPDTLVGTDSHTTMINGLGVLGWGVGGIEAEAVMLGQPISMLIPEVIGFKLYGQFKEGVTATDLVLTVTEMLRKKGVVGKFVEFYGTGLDSLSLPDRATVANMAPEYGATVGFFPVDEKTLDYLHLTGRSAEVISRVEAYTKEQGLFRTTQTPDPIFSDVLELDLGKVEPSLAGPKRPQDRVPLKEAKQSFRKELLQSFQGKGNHLDPNRMSKWLDEGGSAKTDPNGLNDLGNEEARIDHGSVVIAAITSCTNTSNPAVMVGAGLLAQKAVERGLTVKPWVKTSLAPGSKVVMEYLRETKLIEALEKLKFNLVGFGCTTCIGNSGPLPEPIAKTVQEHDLVTAAVLSGNRNFEGRINPLVRANYLASPPLVVAYALAGSMNVDLVNEPIGKDPSGKPVYLRDIWPTQKEISQAMRSVTSRMFQKQYAQVFEGDSNWKAIQIPKGNTFSWEPKSTYVKNPPFFEHMKLQPEPLKDVKNARVLVVLGDSVTTDHISPAGSIAKDSPAGQYLIENGVDPKHFNSYGARRGNYEVMVRGTFANVRLKNLLVLGTEGWWTQHFPAGGKMSIFDAAMKYRREKVPLIILAGKEYGSGSSRDWAAKGPALLGVKAVIAESFERIHRSNLIGMGILPLEFETGRNCEALGLSGEEVFDISGIQDSLAIGKKLNVTAQGTQGEKKFLVKCRIDTPAELGYYQHGGILQYVLRMLLERKSS